MPPWPWIEHTFNFDYPVAKFPEIVERLRGTPARVVVLLEGLRPELLVRRPDQGWSIQENVGHLTDIHSLMFTRLDELLAGAAVLTAADMDNRRTHAANHNARPIVDVLAKLRAARARFVARLEACAAADWSRTALHPRLNRPMRLVDHALFFAEHDDYHLARISELRRMLDEDRPAGS
ncbi:MAG: DinB family protein [Planctomycetota bacterium]